MLGMLASLLLLGDFAADPTPTAGPGGAEITNPVWERQPTTHELFCFFPDRALRNEALVGGAVLHCTATAAGDLAACQVMEERPANWQFGAAAMAASPVYKLKLLDAAGASVAGRPITVTVRFSAQNEDARATHEYCRTLTRQDAPKKAR